ncbi:MAG: hypothetical protein V3U65_07095 [Granulosicoccaceae bacterium]
MPLLWEHTNHDTHYSVRRAGESIRLYSNGVFHTQWNPRKPFAGGVWDCLSLPSLYRSTAKQQRVLVLGLGGGAIVQQLQSLLPDAHITAVEIDPIHIQVARDWFGITDGMADIVEADAVTWLASYKGAGFDYIVDDLFGHFSSDVRRSHQLDISWLKNLGACLNADGTLVCNCESTKELKSSLASYRGRGFVEAYSWHLSNYDNAIGVFLREPIDVKAWSRNLGKSGLSAFAKKQALNVSRRKLALI